METTGKKSSSASQTTLNVLLVIVCCAIFGLFIYDYINKNKELKEFRKHEQLKAAEKEKQLKKIEGIANLYRDAAISNVPEGIVPSEESQRIKEQIAQNVTANLAPILNKVDKDQNLTIDKINKIQNELMKLLKDETKKSQNIRQELAKAVKAERRKEDELQKHLTQTQKVVGELNGLVGELKAKYIAEHEDDSALGDIARTAAAPAKFVKNTFTFDWWVGRDKMSEDKKYNIRHREIMRYYYAIGNPAAMKRLQTERRKRYLQYQESQKKKKEHQTTITEVVDKVINTIEGKQSSEPEPEIMQEKK